MLGNELSLLNLLWLSPATLSAPPALKYIQLKLELQESQKVDEKGNSKILFCENTFISCFAGAGQDQILSWFALIEKFFCLEREEGAWPFIHFELALLALGYHELSVQRDIYILPYHITSALKRSLTNPLHRNGIIPLKTEKTSDFSSSVIPMNAHLSFFTHSLVLHFLTPWWSLWTIRILS